MPKFKRPKDCITCPYKSSAFEKLPSDILSKLHEKCLIVDFKKGENFAKQGTLVTHSLYLSKGLAKIYVEGRNKNIILKLIPAGNFIGLHSIFSKEKIYNFSVSAIVRSQVCMVTADFFLELASLNHNFLKEVTQSISDCTSLIFDKIASLNQKSARGRIADIILYLADDVYNKETFELPITRRELAELASISMENAVRILSEFRNEGIIKIDGRTVGILQRDILEKISIIS